MANSVCSAFATSWVSNNIYYKHRLKTIHWFRLPTDPAVSPPWLRTWRNQKVTSSFWRPQANLRDLELSSASAHCGEGGHLQEYSSWVRSGVCALIEVNGLNFTVHLLDFNSKPKRQKPGFLSGWYFVDPEFKYRWRKTFYHVLCGCLERW